MEFLASVAIGLFLMALVLGFVTVLASSLLNAVIANRNVSELITLGIVFAAGTWLIHSHADTQEVQITLYLILSGGCVHSLYCQLKEW